jgi:uncharacterized protein
VLRRSLDAARLGDTDRRDGFAPLERFVHAVEERFEPVADFEAVMAHERAISPALGGRSVFDGRENAAVRQLRLF